MSAICVITATRIGNPCFFASFAIASSARPSALPYGDWYERKTLSESRTSLAGSPSARAVPAAIPATAAASANARSRLTASIGAGGRPQPRPPRPPGARRRRRGAVGRRSSGGVVEERHVEGRASGRRDLEGQAPVAHHDERGRRTRERPRGFLGKAVREL